MLHVLFVFYTSLCIAVRAVDEKVLAAGSASKRVGYVKGDPVPVSCLNRTMYVFDTMDVNTHWQSN